MPGVFDTLSTIKELADSLQSLLDPFVRQIAFSGPETVTGALTATSVKIGQEVSVRLTAGVEGETFRALGFYDSVGKRWPFMFVTLQPSILLNNGRDIVFAVTHSLEFAWESTLGGANTGIVSFPAGAYTWEIIAAGIETQLKILIDATLGGSSTVAVTVPITGPVGGPFFMEPEVEIDSGTDTWVLSTFAVATTGDPGFAVIAGSGYFLGGATPTIQSITFIATGNIGFGGLSFTIITDSGTDVFFKSWIDYSDWLSYGFYTAVDYANNNITASDRFDPLAQILNGIPGLTILDGQLRAQFVGGTRLEIRALGIFTETLRVFAPPLSVSGDGFTALGFTPSTTMSEGAAIITDGSSFNVVGTSPTCFEDFGTTIVEAAIRDVFLPPEPTLFSVVTGAAELLYAASGSLVPFQVFPGETTAGRVPTTQLPRDIIPSAFVTDAMANVSRFGDGFLPSPIEAGVQPKSDLLWLYEQRILLEPTIAEAEADIASDRVIAVITTFGSNIITLPSANEPDFNFLDATSDDEFDEAQVGDLVFLEEGQDAGGYTVTARSELTLTLDRVMTESSGRIFSSGNDGVIEQGTVILKSESARFTEDDVGRFVTIWATNRQNYDGSYRIVAVNDLGTDTEIELDTDDFPETEQEIHWAVVKAPTEDPGDSLIDGRTALVGVRPIRIYNGRPREFRVVEVSPHLDRTLAEVTVIHEVDEPPKKRIKQPYQFIRNGVQHISATAMKSQGRELGLYWFDILGQSLGGDAIHNIPEDTRMEPVFGTYESEGYRLEVDDPELVFSSEEQTTMVMSPQFLPVGFNDTVSNKVIMDGTGLRITHDTAPVVGQIQTLLTSAADRILCANPLTRHFLPGYVYLDINISGGNTPSKIATEIITDIEALEPTEDLDVSKLERILHNNSVIRYDHPIEVLVLTHDLDRRIVGFRSVNKIGEEEVVYNGSNRTSFFIPGPNRSDLTSEADVPDGERIRIIRGIPTTTLR
jgi:hypothetical protein